MTHARTLDIGRDVHNDASAVAAVAHEHEADVIARGPVGTRHGAREHLRRTRPSKAPPLLFV
jgi:hypothetical protein